MVRKAKRGPKRASKRGVVKSSSKGKGVKKYLAENWASILLLVVIIVLLIVGIVYSQKSCRRNRIENMANMDKEVLSEPSLVMFHAPWCGHCKRALPEFKKAMNNLKNSSGKKVKGIAINADEETELAQKHGVKGYPTIKYYPKGLDGGNPIDHTGERTVAGFKEFCSKQ